jgi:NAD(P)H-hydrate epimerase
MSQTISLSRKQSRIIDQIAIEQYGIPGIVLMENAGRGISEWLLQFAVTGPVVVCCGKGNNGGDGFVIARYLAIAGRTVEVLMLSRAETIEGDAGIQLRIATRMGIPLQFVDVEADSELIRDKLAGADWIVDGLLGTGTQGAVRSPFMQAIEAINASGRPVLAIDLPSGMDCDTGEPLGRCIKATRTATMVTRKIGFDQPAAVNFLGEVRVVPIGIPEQIILQASEAER